MFLFSNFKDVIIDIKNYLQLLYIIRKHKNSEEWKSLNLRSDWIGRIYTVISLRKEDFGDTEVVRRLKINKQLAMPIFVYLTEKLNLVELLNTRLEYIKGSYSYLLYFVPSFTRLSLWYIIKFTIFIYLVYSILDIFNINFWINKLIEFLISQNILK